MYQSHINRNDSRINKQRSRSLKQTLAFGKDELMVFPQVSIKDQYQEFAPLIRSFARKDDDEKMGTPEIQSNADDDGDDSAERNKDDSNGTNSPTNSSEQSSMTMSDFSGICCLKNANEDDGKVKRDKGMRIDLMQINVKKLETGPNCSKQFVPCDLTPVKARSSLRRMDIEKTPSRKR